MDHQSDNNSQLHMLENLRGFNIGATDGDIGSIKDFVVATASWTIRHLVIDTGNWLPGKKVILPVDRIEQVDWDNKRVSVSITREQLKESPGLDALEMLNREYEQRLFDHYQRPGYWIKKSRVDEASWESFPASDPPGRW